MIEQIHYRVVPSRFGDAALVWRASEQDQKIIRVILPSMVTSIDLRVREIWPHARAVHRRRTNILYGQIKAYLDGAKIGFSLDPLDFSDVSAFQEQVLRMEHRIPYGRVSTYSRLALRLGRPGAARAVGNALARNPFPLIIPCHRTLCNDGHIGGFQGGTDLKRALLSMEGVRCDARGRVQKIFFV